MPDAKRSVHLLVEEYQALLQPVRRLGNRDVEWENIEQILHRDADWTEQGAIEVSRLARDYGSFMLRNALAIALALGVEDGEQGF